MKYLTIDLTGPLLAALLMLTGAGCGSDETAAAEGGAPVEATAEHAEGEHAEGEGEGEHAEGEAGGDEVAMTPAAIREAGVVVREVAEAPVALTFTAPGRVVPGLNGSSRVGALVAGRVVRLYAAEGTAVRQGAPLADVESMEATALQGQYLQATAAIQRAQAGVERAAAGVERSQVSLARHEQLAAEQLIPRDKLEEVREDYRTAQADVRASRAEVQAAQAEAASVRRQLGALGLGAPTAQGGGSARFTVRAPIGGSVTQRAVGLGEYVEPGTDMFEIAAAGSDVVEAQVSAQQAEGLRVGQTVTVVAGDSTRRVGQLVAIAPVVEAESRTIPVRIQLRQGGLRLETFVSVLLARGGERRALVVPLGAVERAADGTFVYVEDEPNTFARTEVALGQELADGVEVTSGLTAGSRIVTEGVFYVRSARQRGELAEHDH